MQFKRILDLVRRTGDRMVVTDPEGKEPFVVMDLDTYESLLDMEDAVIDGISEADELPPTEEGTEPVAPPEDIWEAMPPAGSRAATWDVDSLKEEEKAELGHQYHEFKSKKTDSPKPIVQNTAEKTQKNEEEFGEEQFYLEPIE